MATSDLMVDHLDTYEVEREAVSNAYEYSDEALNATLSEAKSLFGTSASVTPESTAVEGQEEDTVPQTEPTGEVASLPQPQPNPYSPIPGHLLVGERPNVQEILQTTEPNYVTPTPEAEAIVEEEQKGFLNTAFDVAEFVLSPIIALTGAEAALSTIARPSQKEGIIEATAENLSTAGQAFWDRLTLDYGEDLPNYSAEVADKILPEETPIYIKEIVSGTLDVIDPAMIMGGVFYKTIREGLRIAAQSRWLSDTADTFKGIFQEGLLEIFGVGSTTPEQLEALGPLAELAKKADAGDQEAIMQLRIALTEDISAAKAAESMETQSGLRQIDAVLDELKHGPAATRESFEFIDEGLPYGAVSIDNSIEAKIKSLSTNEQFARIMSDLTEMNDPEDIENMLNAGMEYFKKQYRKTLGTLADQELIDRSQNNQLYDLLGKEPYTFLPEEAYALRQMLLSTNESLIKAAKDTQLPGVNAGVARARFVKSLAINLIVQSKATDVGAHAGRLLHSFNVRPICP